MLLLDNIVNEDTLFTIIDYNQYIPIQLLRLHYLKYNNYAKYVF